MQGKTSHVLAELLAGGTLGELARMRIRGLQVGRARDGDGKALSMGGISP
jgi:hypothetical protein